MAVNLRERAEADLFVSLEGAFGLPVELIAPDGTSITLSENDGETLVGQVLYDTVRINPETGEDVVVNNPVVTLRRSSLSRIPVAGEKWVVKIPTTPSVAADKSLFVIDPTRPPESGASIGFIKLYLRKAQQKTNDEF